MLRKNRAVLGLLLSGSLLLAVYFFYTKLPSSEVIISDYMKDFIDAIDKAENKNHEKIILFDLDDTVLMSKKILGTPTWFYNSINYLRSKGASKKEALDVISHIDRFVQEHSEVILVEHTTMTAINSWQEQGAIVVGLSSRPHSFKAITERQLRDIGLKFSHKALTCIEKQWPEDFGRFIDGVLYVGHSLSKGELASQFLSLARLCELKPTIIAYADDQDRYVREMAKVAENEGAKFIGIIYGGALLGRDFDIRESNFQLNELEMRLETEVIPSHYREFFAHSES
jgi:hypothetical protein